MLMRIIWGILLLLALTAVACGDEFEEETNGSATSGPTLPASECWRDPWICPAGQVCWLADNTSVACFNQGQGELFDECEPFAGTPDCEEGMFCLRLDQNLPGYCSPFCDPQDPNRACPENGRCLTLGLPENTSIQLNVCETPNSGL
jgi:hypothetical protein